MHHGSDKELQSVSAERKDIALLYRNGTSLKLNILNILGSITGGMTSTPALGTLINVTGTEDVASAYAATYPIALISVVLCAQMIIIFFS